MLEILKSIDQEVFLFLNGLHCSFFDPVMFWGTKTITWLPLYLMLIYLVIRQYQWQTPWILLAAGLMILLSDQLSNIFKDWIMRPRPTYEPGLTGIHTVNDYDGGMYGFYSAHASTNMAVAIFLIMILVGRYRWLPPLILFYAFFMSYSRIYLGLHYPGDIIAGWFAGSLIGFCSAMACLRLVRPRAANIVSG
jgi:undecaprenyl-diphosphatase